MRKAFLLWVGLFLLLFLSAYVTATEFPKEINYQGMLTTPGGSPVLDGSYSIKFTIWSHETSTSASYKKWEHTYSVTVTNGLFNVLLGEGDPIDLPFTDEYWLGIEVGADPALSPRTKLTSVGYAYRALVADTAYVAAPGSDMDERYVNVAGPDSIIGNTGDYLFRIRNYGDGGALAIKAVGGTSADGITIDTAANNGIEVYNTGNYGIRIDDTHDDAINIIDAGDVGIYIYNTVNDGIYVSSPGGEGVKVYNAKGRAAFDANRPDTHGVYIYRSERDGVYIDSTYRYGIYMNDIGDDGIFIDHADDKGVRVDDANYGIYAVGRCGNHLFSISSSYRGLYVHSYGSSSANPGLYVYGTFQATGSKSTVVNTSQGMEALYSIEGPDVEFMASGRASLMNGQAEITFERLFQEAISTDIPLKIILTPKGGWSGLYVSEQSFSGFTVLTAAGEQSIDFDWMAIGRRKGYEQRPVVQLADIQQIEALDQEELEPKDVYYPQDDPPPEEEIEQ